MHVIPACQVVMDKEARLLLLSIFKLYCKKTCYEKTIKLQK